MIKLFQVGNSIISSIYIRSRCTENSIWISRSILREEKSSSSIVNFQLKNRGIRVMDTSNPATDMFTYIHTYIYTRTLEQNKVGQAWRYHVVWQSIFSPLNFWSPLQMATRLIEIPNPSGLDPFLSYCLQSFILFCTHGRREKKKTNIGSCNK